MLSVLPLVIADTTRGTGHFNLAQGVVGRAVGIGASFNTTLAGYVRPVRQFDCVSRAGDDRSGRARHRRGADA